MKLLVLAQSTVPGHGQSRAVGRLVAALRAEPGLTVIPVEWNLSRTVADVGRWRPGKVVETFRIALRVLRARWAHGPLRVYYVPAPGKRGALYRDWVLLLAARVFHREIVLHWHAVGLGEWLGTRGSGLERWISRRALGGAELAIVQSAAVRADAEYFRPKRCVVIPNGVPDPLAGTGASRTRWTGPAGPAPIVVFVGLGCAEKGLFDALDGVRLANARLGSVTFRFQAIGPFASPADEREFAERAGADGGAAVHWGYVSDDRRNELLQAAQIFCFPSYYPHEGQPAVLLEALACRLPIITTRWRAIPENLPEENVFYVDPRRPDQIAAALLATRTTTTAGENSRRHYLEHFTLDRHHEAMRLALLSLP